MISDRELAKQVLERDVINLYRQIPDFAKQLGVNVSPVLGMFEDKILGYTNIGVDMVVDWLFGVDMTSNIDEASDIAKMVVNDKIEEYRQRVRDAKLKETL